MTAWRDWRRRQVKEFWSHPFPKEGKGWGTQHVSFKFRGKTGPSTPLPPVATLRMTDVGIIPTLSPTQGDKGRAPQLGPPTRSYLDALRGSRPRNFSMGWMLGGAPRQASYILARSSVLPRERTIWRKRSPLARVSPPWSSNHW